LDCLSSLATRWSGAYTCWLLYGVMLYYVIVCHVLMTLQNSHDIVLYGMMSLSSMVSLHAWCHYVSMTYVWSYKTSLHYIHDVILYPWCHSISMTSFYVDDVILNIYDIYVWHYAAMPSHDVIVYVWHHYV
jgi:hypothetical protein